MLKGMNSFSERLEDKLAYLKAGRGEGIGPTSRVLSNVNILITYLLVTLIKTHFYLPAILILLLGFTRFSLLSFIGFLIYFVFIHYWTGVSIMALLGIVGWMSAWAGMNNIKKNLHNNKAKVDPFEGMTELLFITIFQIIFLILALIASGFLIVVFGILFAIVTLFEMSRYYYRLSSPWRQLHYPLMARYAFFVGLQAGIAEKAEKKFDINATLIEFVKNIYPDWTQEEVESFLKSVAKKMEKFTDREDLVNAFKKDNFSLNTGKLNKVLDRFHESFKIENPRWVIAEIVERDYGKDEKIKYLQSIVTGRSNVKNNPLPLAFIIGLNTHRRK